MTLSSQDIAGLAKRVEAAQIDAHTLSKLTADFPAMTVTDGYAVQDDLRQLCVDRGQRIVGFKAGLTSRAKMKQMGVDVPSFGFLSNEMECAEGEPIDLSGLIHPRIEAEIAFVTGQDLTGPDCTIDQVLAATDFVVPAIEVIDSRFERFSFDLPSVVADNSSAARFVVGGRPRRPADIDLRHIGVVIERNGAMAATAAAAAVLGHPAAAVALLVNHLTERGEILPAGSLVLTGAITEAFAMESGDFASARFQDLGSVSVRFS